MSPEMNQRPVLLPESIDFDLSGPQFAKQKEQCDR